jgi:DNA replication licensing factor MCM2
VCYWFILFRLDSRLNATSGFPTFATYILVNNLERRSDMQINEMSEEDIEIIHRLSQNKHIREKIIDSIAPSLWGHRLIKTGLAYAMFGGVERVTTGNHVIRGDINFLILGKIN